MRRCSGRVGIVAAEYGLLQGLPCLTSSGTHPVACISPSGPASMGCPSPAARRIHSILRAMCFSLREQQCRAFAVRVQMRTAGVGTR